MTPSRRMRYRSGDPVKAAKTLALSTGLGIAVLASTTAVVRAQTTTVALALVDGSPMISADSDGHQVRLVFDLGQDSDLVLTRETVEQLKILPSGPNHP